MDTSFFMDKEQKPTHADLLNALDESFKVWIEFRNFVFEKYPNAIEEWNFPGKKYGWSFRIKDKKRAIIYLLPREKYFKVAFVFGQKATNFIMDTQINNAIKKQLTEAKVYAEGRGIRVDVTDDSLVDDIKRLIEIKLAF